MKAKWTIIVCCLLTLLAIGAGVVISRQPVKSPPPARAAVQKFQAKGVVLNVEAGSKTVVIEHEDIPQFMPAMTMPFTVKDPALLRGLQAGDRVRFELTVTKTDSWVSKIAKQSGPAATSPAATSAGLTQPPSETPELQVGQPVPDFTLTGQNGRRFHLSDFRGRAVLVTFVYTRCPLPNYCPLMSKNFSELQERFNKAFPGRFHLVTVSFDPDHDTPEVLKRYAEMFTHDESSWTFATGTRQQINTVASEFGLVYLPATGSFTHDLRTAFIAPDGRLIHIWRSNVWTPYEVQRRVAEVLNLEPRALVSAGQSKIIGAIP